MTDEKVLSLAKELELEVECLNPLELADVDGSRATGCIAKTMLSLAESRPVYIEAGFVQFLRKCQLNGFNHPTKFLAVNKHQLVEFFKLLQKALQGEALPNAGKCGSTYGSFGCDVSITITDTPDDTCMVVPCHESTMRGLCAIFDNAS